MYEKTGPINCLYFYYVGNNIKYYGCSLADSSNNPRFSQNPNEHGLLSFPERGVVYRFYFTTTGINDINNNTSLKLYPNPTYNKLTVKSEQIIEAVEVYN